ncbi:hypothetical protein [Emticicia fluvialis]|uniref:hypothetical protein n=1 Tax=Emticicia fluvialis TaxID=2974474 RepID=UPI00216581D0|nr:hypothetical protein [Emticicia fluvialis]
MKRNLLTLAFALAFLPSLLFAQDIIIKNDKSEIKAKVVEITVDFIKYNDWDNLTGPIYNIAKKDVFMITYQNGKREFITAETSATPTKARATTQTRKEAPTDVQEIDLTGGTPAEGSPFEYTPRDKTQPKSPTNYADRVSYTGVALNSIGKATIPTIQALNDWFLANNIALSYGVAIGYNSIKESGIELKTSAFTGILGGAYYLNEALKIDKRKAAAYVGVALYYAYASTTSNYKEFEVSGGNLGVLARAGGKYNFAKRLGGFAEIQVSKGDPAIIAGLSISINK